MSVSMEDNSSDDLLTKYQRLAIKYSKMRAQITVLKTAFTEEQTKGSEMKDSIKERDQSIRKLSQEMESIDFRNQQLAKRVAVLQEELSAVTLHNNTKKWTKSRQSSGHSTPQHNSTIHTNGDIDDSVFGVINSELQSKITENERLHIQLNTIETDFIEKISEMQRQLDEIRSEEELKHKSLIESLDSKQLIIHSLNEEKHCLESKLKSIVKDLDETRLLAQNLETQNKSLENKLQSLKELNANNVQTRDNLLRQLNICESKLSTAEQAVEHWMLESQLIQVKLDKELKRAQELEVRTQSECIAQTQTSIQTSSSTPSGSQRSIDCNDFAGSSLQSPTASEDKISLNSNTGAEEELPQVTAYLRNRISQLIDSLHVSDSKSVAFHTECLSLQQRLSLLEKQRKHFTEDIDSKEYQIQELREELATNVSNYENQLSLMSEHLANMNDKLTQQTDEIDSLKANHSVKGKKAKNK